MTRFYFIVALASSLLVGSFSNRALGEPGSSFPLPNLSSVALTTITLSPANLLSAKLKLSFPDGYGLSPTAPSQLRAWIAETRDLSPVRLPVKEAAINVPLAVPLNLTSITVRMEAVLYYCRDDHRGACLIKSYSFTQPVVIEESAAVATDVEFEASLQTPAL